MTPLERHKHISLMGEPPQYVEWYIKEDVEKHYLDKQRVKGSIEWLKTEIRNSDMVHYKWLLPLIDEAFKQFGLNK